MYKTIERAGTDEAAAKTQAILLTARDQEAEPSVNHSGVPESLRETLETARQRPEFAAKPGATLTLYPAPESDRVVLVGLGAAESVTSQVLREAGAALLRALRDAKADTAAVHLPDDVVERVGAAAAGRSLGEGMHAANLRFNAFHGAARAEKKTSLERLAVTLDSDEAGGGFDEAGAVAKGVTTARTLAATPPNLLNPATLADHCEALAAEVGLQYRVIDAEEAEGLGMGGLLAVGRAGSEPPRMIVLEWRGGSDAGTKGRRDEGAGGETSGGPVLLVGKAITFDTGGLSLKTGGSMKGMKYDKCGGMAVIGAMEAVARLDLPVRVVGLIAAAENMIDREAYRVDDILTMYNGVTVEVTNTDAEGRLVLADALAYGTDHFKPRAVADLATLTGGVVTALGDNAAGLFCPDETLRQALIDAGEASGERVWPLPLWDEHREMMKADHADLHNSANTRNAHPIQGAAFLSYFVGDEAPTKMPTTPWAHLDIAGMASKDSNSTLFDKGPTGYGVRLLVDWLQNL